MTEPRIIAEVRSQDGWEGMLNALRLAFDQMGASYRTVNDLAGFTDGHAEKLLAPLPIKNMGPATFGPLLGALGAKIIVVVDESASAYVRGHHRYQARRRDAPSRFTSKKVRKSWERKRKAKLLPSERARAIRAISTLKSTPAERKRRARHAATIRWNDVKAAVEAAKTAQRCVEPAIDKS